MARLYGPGPGKPPPLVSTYDLAGLSASDVEGRPVGELVGTLSDKKTGLIRYLDIALAEEQKHVLVPIGHARFDRRRVPPRVKLRAATYGDLRSVPPYDGVSTDLDPAFQAAVLRAHSRSFYGSRYYAHPAFDHGSLYAGGSPIEGPGGTEPPPGERPLQPLSEAEAYQIADGEPDIRGWMLQDAHGERVGEVVALLVDTTAGKARYAVVRLDDPERTTALPIGYVQIAETSNLVYTPDLEVEDLRMLPPYEPPMDRAQETRVQAAIEGRFTGSRYYRRSDFRTE